MKKILFGVLAVITMFSLVACGESNHSQNDSVPPIQQQVEETVDVIPEIEDEPFEEEQIGVGNTDEGMVALVLEEHLKSVYGEGVIEEFNPVEIKVYTPEEIAADEIFNDYDIKEGDIVFDAHYEFKIADDFEGELIQFTAATGDIDGNWIREKYNVGILRSGEDGYTMDAFGTAF